MHASQARLQFAGIIGPLGGFDARDRNILDEDMRRFEDQGADGPAPGPGMNKRDRAAVAMADQDRIGDAERLAQRRQFLQRGAMHVIGPARQLDGIGFAVAEPRIDYGAGTGLGGKPRGKIAPRRDRAKALVKEDEIGRVFPRRRNLDNLDGVAGESEGRHESNPEMPVQQLRLRLEISAAAGEHHPPLD